MVGSFGDSIKLVLKMTLDITFVYLDTSSSWQVGVAMMGKFAVAGSFGFVYLYTAELFPTQVRNLGVGMTSIGARIGGILAPMVLLLVGIATCNTVKWGVCP